MKRFIVFLVLALVCTLSAEEIESKIKRVTVYKSQAFIEREAEQDFSKGKHSVIFTDLPKDLISEKAKIKINNKDVVMLDFMMDMKTKVNKEEKKHDLEIQLKNLQDSLAFYSDKKNRLFNKKDFLENSLKNSVQIKDKDLDVNNLAQILKFVSNTQPQIDKDIRTVKKNSKRINQKIKLVQAQIRDLNKKHNSLEYSYEMKVVFKNEKRQKVKFEITYPIYGTRWFPEYDLFVSDDYQNVNLAFYANIIQNTSEDWKDVELKLSTADPSINEDIPELLSWILDKNNNRLYKPKILSQRKKSARPSSRDLHVRGGRRNEVTYALDGMSISDPVDDEASSQSMNFNQSNIKVGKGKTKASFNLKETASIPSDNEAHKKLILQEIFEIESNFYIVPRISEKTYIKASLENNSEITFLPGEVNIYLNNTYLNTNNFPKLLPAEKTDFSLGTTEKIKVDFEKVNSTRSKKSFMGNVVTEVNYKIEVENYLAEKCKIEVEEFVPIAKSKQITIEIKDTNIPYEERTKIQKRKGRMIWNLELEPPEKKEIKYGFEIVAPKEYIFEF